MLVRWRLSSTLPLTIKMCRDCLTWIFKDFVPKCAVVCIHRAMDFQEKLF